MTGWLWAICIVGALLANGCRQSTMARPVEVPSAATTSDSPAVAGLQAAGVPSDEEFWRMSRDVAVVSAGRAAFNSSSCRTCHAVALTGGPGPNLIDQRWLHGGTPREVFQTITKGVQSKGMPQWGPVLGPAMITQIVAFIFSFHHEGEPIQVQASFTPFTPAYE